MALLCQCYVFWQDYVIFAQLLDGDLEGLKR